jgi:hypothetical protein
LATLPASKYCIIVMINQSYFFPHTYALTLNSILECLILFLATKVGFCC